MSTASKLLILALGTFTLTAAVPKLAQACGPYGQSAAERKAIKLEKAERKRLAKLRAKRADRCVVGSIAKITEEAREKMWDLPLDAKPRRSVAVHYPLFSEDDYDMSLYMTGLTLNRFGFAWSDLNTEKQFEGEFRALRPAGKGEWMMVRDFKAECPQPVEVNPSHMEALDSL